MKHEEMGGGNKDRGKSAGRGGEIEKGRKEGSEPEK